MSAELARILAQLERAKQKLARADAVIAAGQQTLSGNFADALDYARGAA